MTRERPAARGARRAGRGDRLGTDPGWAQGCREVARVDNGLGVENGEQGGAVLVCDGPRGTWVEAWERVRRLSA